MAPPPPTKMPHYSSGNPTFKNISTIDYFLCCPLLFQHINIFIVHDSNPSFSDGHSVLEMVLATANSDKAGADPAFG